MGDGEIDLLLHGGRVHTLDDAHPSGRGVAVHHGRIVAVTDELPAGVRARRRVDLDGATLVPGFGDAHNHMASFGQNLGELDLSGCADLDALYAAVAAYAADLPADAFVVGAGYDDVALGGSPHRHGLDRAGDGRPVWLTHRSGHVAAVSTVVLERCGARYADPPLPPGGVVVRDADGDPTGVLEEEAQSLVADLLRPHPVAEVAEAIARAGRVYAAQGLTHVTECGIGGGWVGRTPRELAAYQLARARGELPVRVTLMPIAAALHDVDGGPGTGLDLGMTTGFGDDELRLGPVKLFVDGALSSRTAALSAPYADRSSAGQLQEDPEVLHRRIVEAHRGGWAVAAHAIGDRAVALALDAFADAQAGDPRPHVRHRIEHAGMADDAAIARMAALGVTPVPQARFLVEIGDSMRAAVGEERAALLYRHAAFLRAGLRVPASSDRPCVHDGSPLATMAAMITRRSADGAVLGPGEAVDAATALRALTVDTAWIAGDEHTRGRIAPGLLADLVVLGDDPLRLEPARLPALEVVATLRGGRATHGAAGLGLPR